MEKEQYVAFLRGINVGGHHKVPMAELRREMEKMGFEKVMTLLNSGNVVFEAKNKNLKALEGKISGQLENAFGFPIPTILRKAASIQELWNHNPFKDENLTKDIRWYVSFLPKASNCNQQLPWASSDKSFKIIGKYNLTVLSVLDLAVSNTPKAMEALERFFGKDITTRNWNTIKRVAAKFETNR